MLGVPLIVEGELVGVLHVGSITPRTFGQKDVAVLQLAAARAAPAIERAGLVAKLEREHEVALLLQRSLLPRQLPRIAGVSVAARYLAARAEVGGDWYDVIELPRGLLGIAIGDVVGHGIQAAALMGQMRTALRAYAQEGHGAGRTLELVDRYVQSTGMGSMATAAYGVFDPDTGVLRFANAGHVPPVIVTAEKTRLLEVPPCAPLGAYPYGNCHEHELRLEADELLVMYTDGLVERRGQPLNDGLDELLEVLAGVRSAEEACLAAIRSLTVASEAPRDDIAIVALHNQPIPAELELELPAVPSVLAHVRRLIRRWLRDRGAGSSEIVEITMAVSEACANAVEHAYSPAPHVFRVQARIEGDEVVVGVRDTGRWRAPRGRNRGRGLTIIEAAMDAVHVSSSRRWNRNRDATDARTMRLADLHFSARDDHVVAAVVGEIDMSNAEELARALADETPNDAHGLVLDLSRIDYLDSAGIHLLYRLRESVSARGLRLAIVVPKDSPVFDALRLAGIERHLDVLDTVDAAFAPTEPRGQTA